MAQKTSLIFGFWFCIFPVVVDAQGFKLQKEIIIPTEKGEDFTRVQAPFIRQRYFSGGSQNPYGSINNAENSNFYDFENDGVPEIVSFQTSSFNYTKIVIYDGANYNLKYTIVVDSASPSCTDDGSAVCAGFFDVDGDGVRELVGEFTYYTNMESPRANTRLLFIDVRTGQKKYTLPAYNYYTSADGYDGYAIYDINNDSYPEVLCHWHNTDSIAKNKFILRIYGHSSNLTNQPTPGLAKKASTINNLPNPIRGSAKIEYYITSNEENVELVIYNLEGKLIRTLVNERQKMGEYNLLWDGKTESGRNLAAGQYYFVLKAGNFTSTRKSISLW